MDYLVFIQIPFHWISFMERNRFYSSSGDSERQIATTNN